VTRQDGIVESVLSTFDWMRNKGMDFAYLENDGTFTVGMKVKELARDDWNHLEASQLVAALDATGETSNKKLNVTSNGPAFFGFKTPEGSLGILQITGFIDNQRGVKIRYKLVESREASAEDPGQTVAGLPPVVVETFPASGASDVEPGDTEIDVRFSKEMTDGAWSWAPAWPDSTPEIIAEQKYNPDHRAFVIPARLEPGRTYAFWLNSDKLHGFTDMAGRPAVPYLLIFSTKPN